MIEIKGYEILESVHESHQSHVYRAVRKEDGSRVALKTPAATFPGARQLSSLSREYELLNRLKLESVPKAFELIDTGFSLVLALEYFDCLPLRDLTVEGAGTCFSILPPI